MKNRKIQIIIFAFIVLLSFHSCVKDDSPYPDIVNTSWFWDDGDRHQSLSFTDNVVKHIMIEGNDTIVSFSGRYSTGCTYGEHFYTWDNDSDGIRYKVYSYGRNHIMLGRELLPFIGPLTMVDPKRFYCFTKE